ncbi:MAG: PKD domain-containing protein [Nanoarchaeota archaeon]|nr:PKD domain-containing protein [Nanoarchaeota archaeon]
MKRGILLILAILIMIPTVLAATTVTLNSPANSNVTSGTSMTFNCSVLDTAYAITSIALYTNVTGTWTQSAITSSNVNSTTFTLSSLTAGTYKWNCRVTNANSNTTFASSNFTFRVASGFSGTIANQSWAEDTNKSNAFDLDTYFTGATSYTVSGNSSIKVLIATDKQISFSPTANYTGSETIRFTSNTGATSNYILLNVTNVNDPPYVTNNITNKSIDINEKLNLTMTSYVTDRDPNDHLNYSITASHFTLVEHGNIVTITPTTGWSGTERVTITATDSGSKTTTISFYIIVGSGVTTTSNTAPSIDSSSPTGDQSIEEGDSIVFIIDVSDAESDTLTISWYVDDVDQSISEETFTFTPTTSGTFTVKVNVYDGTSTTTQSWTVSVGIEEELIVDSIIGAQTNSADCGNGEQEEGETCSSCPLDVVCGSGTVCNAGVCEDKGSGTKALIIFLLIFMGIIVIGVLIYYYTTIKKVGRKPTKQEGYTYSGMQQKPPSAVSDFYKNRK